MSFYFAKKKTIISFYKLFIFENLNITAATFSIDFSLVKLACEFAKGFISLTSFLFRILLRVWRKISWCLARAGADWAKEKVRGRARAVIGSRPGPFPIYFWKFPTADWIFYQTTTAISRFSSILASAGRTSGDLNLNPRDPSAKGQIGLPFPMERMDDSNYQDWVRFLNAYGYKIFLANWNKKSIFRLSRIFNFISKQSLSSGRVVQVQGLYYVSRI